MTKLLTRPLWLLLLLVINHNLSAQKMSRSYADVMIQMAQMNVPAFKNFLKTVSFYEDKEVIIAETKDKLGYNICIYKNDLSCLLTFKDKGLFTALSKDFGKLQNELYPDNEMEETYAMTSYNGWKFFFNDRDYQIKCIIKP